MAATARSVTSAKADRLVPKQVVALAAELATSAMEQLDAIGDMLVRAKIVTRRDVDRQGVRFALRDALERKLAHHPVR